MKNDKKEKPKPEKSVFHRKSDAGKGDVPRTSIPQDEWEEKWKNIFRPGQELKESTD